MLKLRRQSISVKFRPGDSKFQGKEGFRVRGQSGHGFEAQRSVIG
jgi:hypothetical protein